MRKLIFASLITAGMVLLTGGFSTLVYAQNSGPDLKPTFISPTPGLYVNGWPAFTVSYPKEWVELPLGPGSAFRAGTPRGDSPAVPAVVVNIQPSVLPLEDWAKFAMPFWTQFGADMKVLSDKPSQLKDGTPAWEVEVERALKSNDALQGSFTTGGTLNTFMLMTKRELIWVWIVIANDKGRIEEDLKSIAYSLTFQSGREVPVKVPPDVRAFLDMYCADMVSGDVKAIMAHYSDRFLQSGASKAFVEQFIRNEPNSPIRKGVISQEPTVTVFERQGDRAFIDGFYLTKLKGNVDATKLFMSYQQIINENGQWKWYGNHK
jgi:hypothetical protein